MFDNVLEIHTKSPVHPGAQLHIKILHNYALPKEREKGLATMLILTEAVTGAINHQADSPGFACLFRKHDPGRYSICSHRACTLSHWASIARVKYCTKHLFTATY
jgi:hypothetical protein